MVAGGRKKKKKKKKKKEYHIEEVGLGWISRKFFRSASLKPCQEVSKIQKVGKKEKEKYGTRFCEARVL